MRHYMAQGLKRDKCLSICGISKNQYYYKSIGRNRGRKPSEYTLQMIDNEFIRKSNDFVVSCIKSMFANPLVDYGYHRMTGALHLQGFRINHKKVYRLMKNARLLRAAKPRAAKTYVKYRVLCPKGALRLMEMDIKQVWLEGKGRYAYILTVIDVFTRVILHWQVGLSIKQAQVQKAWEEIIEQHLEPHGALAWEGHIEVRSDNGPQFCANKLRKFLKDNYFYQTFTHPYTPQENGHVESFHAILGDALRGQSFKSLQALKYQLVIFYKFYNYQRIHGSTLLLPPMTFWQQWKQGNILRIVVDLKRRKVKFKLKCPRYHLKIMESAGNMNQREVCSLNFEGSTPEKFK